jgi:hypothetical protein
MAANWPGTLPQGLLIKSLRRSFPKNRIRNETLSGRFKSQMIGTQDSERVDGSMMMTTAQLATFKAFYRTTLVEGGEPFDGLTHPRTGVNTTWEFLEDPTDENVGPGLYNVSMILLALPDAPS